jgi:two-component system, OmpR family, sensor kinase
MVAHIIIGGRGSTGRWGTSLEAVMETLRAPSDERTIADLRRALAVRDTLLQVSAHELRSPLNAVMLQVEALLREPEASGSQRIRVRLERALANVRRLQDLLEVLMDSSMLDAGKLALRPEQADVEDVVHIVIDRFEPQARVAGSVVSLHARGRTGGLWDRVRLEQVVGNLLSNALKFGAGAPIEVEVEGGAEQVTIAVQDRGPGVPPECQERIFERFERLPAGRAYPGMGLGLWIVRELVRAMGGAVSVTSAPGAGARFVVTLPRGASGGMP